MSKPITLRNIAGLPPEPARLDQAALILIDCQNAYRRGAMQLCGVEAALDEAALLLHRARQLGSPVFHIQHDSGPGSLFDIRTELGAIAPEVAPMAGEAVIVKHYPNSFVATDLERRLQEAGITRLILAGFMTHMCINSTARGAFNLGFRPTVVARATATRDLPAADGNVVAAAELQRASLAMLNDLFAVIALSADAVEPCRSQGEAE